jgi:hypothetical protein
MCAERPSCRPSKSPPILHSHSRYSVLSLLVSVSLNKHKPAARRPTCEWWDSFTLAVSVWNSLCHFTYRPVFTKSCNCDRSGLLFSLNQLTKMLIAWDVYIQSYKCCVTVCVCVIWDECSMTVPLQCVWSGTNAAWLYRYSVYVWSGTTAAWLYRYSVYVWSGTIAAWLYRYSVYVWPGTNAAWLYRYRASFVIAYFNYSPSREQEEGSVEINRNYSPFFTNLFLSVSVSLCSSNCEMKILFTGNDERGFKN